MKKKLIVMILCISVFAFSIPMTAGASEVDPGSLGSDVIMKPMFVNILSFSNSFNIDSSGVAQCYSSVTYTGGASAYVTCALQKWTGSYWTYVDSWGTSAPANGSLSYATANGYKAVTSGQYRMYSYCQIYNSSGAVIDSTSYTSYTLTY